MYICIYVYICKYVHMYICTYVYMYIYVNMYICIYVHMYICMYVYLYTDGHSLRTSFGKKTKSMQVRASQLEPRDITTESSQFRTHYIK